MEAPRLKFSFVHKRLCGDPAMNKDLKCVQHTIWAHTPNTHTHMLSRGKGGIWQCARVLWPPRIVPRPSHGTKTGEGFQGELPARAYCNVLWLRRRGEVAESGSSMCQPDPYCNLADEWSVTVVDSVEALEAARQAKVGSKASLIYYLELN